MQTRLWQMVLAGAVCVLATSCARDTAIKPEFGRDSGTGTNVGGGRQTLSEDDLGADVPSTGALQAEGLRRVRALGPVYFDYNSAALSGEAQGRLEANADYLRENAGTRVQIEGHCDERGTLEYNLALGERRAQSVRKYLVSQGLSADRLYTISYGEERPARSGNSESAWRQNRRAEFKVAR